MQRISIDTSMKQTFDDTIYNNIYVGLELEGTCDRNCGVVLGELADTFGVPRNDKSGKTRDKKMATTSDGNTIEFTETRNLYNEPKMTYHNKFGSVVAVYHDGSVPLEVVTRPFHILELEKKTKYVHDEMKSKDIDLWARGKAGCHMTLLLNNHMYDSVFDNLVVQNFLQLNRLFYSDIIRGTGMGDNGKTRPTQFRKINQRNDIENLRTDKYCAVNIRRDNATETIWGLEVRAPDGTNDFSKLIETAKFYCALLRFSAHISQYGLIRIEQGLFDKEREFSNRFLERCCVSRKTPRFKALLRQLRPFYKLMGIDTKKEPDEKYAKLFELMLNGASLRDIQTEMPNEFGSLNQIQRQYVKVCGV